MFFFAPFLEDSRILKIDSRVVDVCWICCGIKVVPVFGSSAEWSGRIGAKLLSGFCQIARESKNLVRSLFVLGRAGDE